ncbi:MAG: leucine-rich repeat domain-containing protein, partial [Ureaplasma sp.]|nr:leucine-rich repeat domain-containing protein [Ureaplasma sp.]
SQDAFFKYSVSSNNNVVVENGSLVVKNLTYYLDLTISDENLQNLWTDLNNYIVENEISIGNGGDINNYLNYGIYNLFKNVKTIQNGNLGQFINAPTNETPANVTTISQFSRNIFVTLKSGLYKMSSKNLVVDIGNAIVSNNTISMNNLSLSSPISLFKWSGTEIMGLNTDSNNLVLLFPDKCTSLSPSAFYQNLQLKEIDLYWTKIIKINSKNDYGDLISVNSTFEYCSNLTNVRLPKNLTILGYDTFNYDQSLTNITFNNSLTTLSSYSLYRVGVTMFDFRNLPLKKILSYCFDASSNNPKALSIYLPNTITEISALAFNASSSNGIAFSSGTKIYVNSSIVRSLVISTGIPSSYVYSW